MLVQTNVLEVLLKSKQWLTIFETESRPLVVIQYRPPKTMVGPINRMELFPYPTSNPRNPRKPPFAHGRVLFAMPRVMLEPLGGRGSEGSPLLVLFFAEKGIQGEAENLTHVNSHNVDPGFITPSLLIWGCSPPKVINPH